MTKLIAEGHRHEEPRLHPALGTYRLCSNCRSIFYIDSPLDFARTLSPEQPSSVLCPQCSSWVPVGPFITKDTPPCPESFPLVGWILWLVILANLSIMGLIYLVN